MNLVVVASRLEARTGNLPMATRHIRQAEDAAEGSAGRDPEWLDWYDTARQAGLRGYVELQAGRHNLGAYCRLQSQKRHIRAH